MGLMQIIWFGKIIASDIYIVLFSIDIFYISYSCIRLDGFWICHKIKNKVVLR